MSIFFDFQVGPSGRRFRRAIDGDKRDVEALCKRGETDKLFGDVDIGILIELSSLAICMIDENKEVTGFMAVCDHPNIPGVDPAHWEMWIRNMYQKFYVSRNTLFIHFACWSDTVADYFMEEALISVFNNDAYLLHIVAVVPPKCPEDLIAKYFTVRKRTVYKFPSKSEGAPEKLNMLYTAQRQDFCPKLKIRRGVEEDNDDVVEILEKKCPKLKELYGDYYISEIVGRHTESKRAVIVAEYQGEVVGVMCINSEVNYRMLQTTYELRAYHGLMVTPPQQKEISRRKNSLLKIFGDPIMLGKWSPFDPVLKYEEVAVDDVDTNRSSNAVTTVSFVKRKMRHSFGQLYVEQQTSEDYSEKLYPLSRTPSITTYSVNNLLDGDPFDYEIVNIDSCLFTIPELSTLYVPKVTERHTRRSKSDVKKKKRRSSMAKSDEPETVFNGGPNAFTIELFALRGDIDERRGFDLLEGAFECLKKFQYCILRVPTAEKSFPLLQHFCYVPTKPHVCSSYALYIAHRNSVQGKMRVRLAEFSDIPQLALLLNDLDAKDTIWTIENSIVERRDHQAYVFLSGMFIVGVAILEPPEQIDYIRATFNLDMYQIHKYHTSGHGVQCGVSTLKTAVIHPAFEVHFRYFANEMMRHSDSSSLLWLTAYRNKWVAHKANALAASMIPLLPKKCVMDYSRSAELKKISNLSHNLVPFGTWFISKKLTSIPKFNVDTRIVIVGSSRTAMGFLNILLFSDSTSYLNFTSVTLVSPNGLPYIRHANPVAEKMFTRYRTCSDRFVKSTPYTYYTNVVHGTMVEINKQQKFITLDTGGKCYYDLLFLLFGRQYQHPDYMKSLLETERNIKSGKPTPYARLDVPRYIELEPPVTEHETPENVFIVNNISEANKALNYVQSLRHLDDHSHILVYGKSIHAYCCLNVLLEMGIPPDNIVFIEPFPPEDPNEPRIPVFCNATVDKTIREVLSNLNIRVYDGHYFDSWSVDADNVVTKVSLISHFQMIQLPCSALFYYGKRGINAHAYVAVHKSGIGYDGGILIDYQFRTKDPAVYAAGPSTRYYRRYFADSKRQKYYDSYEVGEKLAAQIKNQLDPLFTEKDRLAEKQVKFSKSSLNFDMCNISGDKSNECRKSKLSHDYHKTNEWHLPNLRKPLMWRCTLPGPMEYLEVRAPGTKVPHYYLQSLQYNGTVMETFKGGYFKLHLTNDFIVDGITCLISDSRLLNFQDLYGLSAAVLNNVHFRFSTKRVDDFYEFFRAPWATFLYHEQVGELFAMVKQLVPQKHRKGLTLEEALRRVGVRLSGSTSRADIKSHMHDNLEKSPYFATITDYVIDWLSENEVLLPMYLEPSKMAQFTHDLGRHPAFRRRRRSLAKMLSTLSHP